MDFTKQIEKSKLIGDILLKYSTLYNHLNNEGWAPIHIASKSNSSECLSWIIQKNEILNAEKKNIFDINIKVINCLFLILLIKIGKEFINTFAYIIKILQMRDYKIAY